PGNARRIRDLFPGALPDAAEGHGLERLLQPRPGPWRADPADPRLAGRDARPALGGRGHLGLVLGGTAPPGLRPRDPRAEAAGVTWFATPPTEAGVPMEMAASCLGRPSRAVLGDPRQAREEPGRRHDRDATVRIEDQQVLVASHQIGGFAADGHLQEL